MAERLSTLYQDRASVTLEPRPGRRQPRDRAHSPRRGDESRMRSIIVDDEESARARLRRLLAAHPEIEIVGEARDGIEAVQAIEELAPGLVFLDIELPGLTGFEVLRALPQNAAMPLVIFVTGYDQHALAAFEANALAYLLKPVEPERLAQAVERARKLAGAAGDRKLSANASCGSPINRPAAPPGGLPPARPVGADAAGTDLLVPGGGRHREGAHRQPRRSG